MPENYFDERIARSYDAKWPELFEPAVVDPAVRFLAGLAGVGPRSSWGSGPGASPSRSAGERGLLGRRSELERGIEVSSRSCSGPAGETVRLFTVTPAHLGFEEFEVATQIAVSHHYWVVDGRLETLSAPFRYVWPSELDLMARLAGMSLRERWADWDRAPFTSDSGSHVSVWEKTMEPVADVLEDPP